MKRVLLFVAIAILLIVGVSYAADVKKLDVGSWGPIIGAFINGVVVLLIAKGLLYLKPVVLEKYPWVWTLLGGILGIILTPIQNFLANMLGYPIDLSPILGVFAAAIGAFIGIANYKHNILMAARKAGVKVGLEK